MGHLTQTKGTTDTEPGIGREGHFCPLCVYSLFFLLYFMITPLLYRSDNYKGS
jgi:hypothetical protein